MKTFGREDKVDTARAGFRKEEVEANQARLKNARETQEMGTLAKVLDPNWILARVAVTEQVYQATMVDISQRRRALLEGADGE